MTLKCVNTDKMYTRTLFISNFNPDIHCITLKTKTLDKNVVHNRNIFLSTTEIWINKELTDFVNVLNTINTDIVQC